MEIQEAKSVQVTNISPTANEKTVSDFFSFCGKISKLYMKKEENGETFSAVVQFETESAAKTALLLTNALIVDRPIVVSAFTQPTDAATADQAQLGSQVDQDNITQRNFNVPDDQRSKTSVIASLIAAGYVVGQDTLVKAKDFDEKHMISLQAKVAVEQIKVKAHEFDKQYGISEKAANISKQINDKAKQIDTDYHISERANTAATTIKTTATTAFNKVTSSLSSTIEGATQQPQAQENPTVNKGLSFMKETANKLNTAMKDFESETMQAIEEKQKERDSKRTIETVEPEPQEESEQPEQPQPEQEKTSEDPDAPEKQ